MGFGKENRALSGTVQAVGIFPIYPEISGNKGVSKTRWKCQPVVQKLPVSDVVVKIKDDIKVCSLVWGGSESHEVRTNAVP